uniref:YphA family membrane protein n=1 Tax=Microaerobacter geothermalis TaxID=674972 RepID=UPI001F2B31CC|nr:hypothetical protein [Microaerobacter geothermalis]
MIFWFVNIVLFSGWMDGWLSKLRMKVWLFAVFSLLYFVMLFFNIQFGQFKINGGFMIFAIFFLYFGEKILGDHLPATVASALLISSVYLLFRMLVRMDPVLLVYDERWMLTGLVTIIGIMIAANKEQMIWFIGIGILIGEAAFQWHLKNDVPNSVIGTSFFLDVIWSSLMIGAILKSVLSKIGILTWVKKRVLKQV